MPRKNWTHDHQILLDDLNAKKLAADVKLKEDIDFMLTGTDLNPPLGRFLADNGQKVLDMLLRHFDPSPVPKPTAPTVPIVFPEILQDPAPAWLNQYDNKTPPISPLAPPVPVSHKRAPIGQQPMPPEAGASIDDLPSTPVTWP